ncbi:hypothetical protein [Salipaludibacillus agaradhaerens]|nr:hypothetical protein [Salipaludibacillus agaradhaerens]
MENKYLKKEGELRFVAWLRSLFILYESIALKKEIAEVKKENALYREP